MNLSRSVPQCSPGAAYAAQAEEIDAAIRRVLQGGWYVLGPEVRAFEEEFAAWLGLPYALGVANGTDALEIALRAVGVGVGDRVFTVAHTAVATVVAIRACGAEPRFVDVDDAHGLLDLDALEAAIAADPGARAVVPVHLYGRCVDMERLLRIARAAGLRVVEDCAQAHGARWAGRPAGSFGDCAAFSFYPTKNLGAVGDGGAIACTDASVVERARLLREYGWKERYVSAVEGGNSRLDELQAAILRVKLRTLDADNARRASIAARYRTGLRGTPLRTADAPAPPHSHVYHQFVVRHPAREDLRRHLREHGIGALVHYPVPVHLQPAYGEQRFTPAPLPRTEIWAREVLSLPMFPQLADEDVDAVLQAISAWRPA